MNMWCDNDAYEAKISCPRRLCYLCTMAVPSKKKTGGPSMTILWYNLYIHTVTVVRWQQFGIVTLSNNLKF